jgi:ABC-type transport system involved in cytochrome bd biosynthesis fused ATPase/permease subunit
MSLGDALEAARPWVSTTALVGMFGLVVKLWLENRKIGLSAETKLRDHYATEVASLRQQVLAIQAASDMRASNAEKRYEEAIAAADGRHHICEEECERLRGRMGEMQLEIDALNRRIGQLNATSIRLFEPKSTLPEDLREQMRSFEQGSIEGEEHADD